MSTVEQSIPPLVAGDMLNTDEFLRRWEAMPGLKRAELIDGIVYMPSPLSWGHGISDVRVTTWLGVYAAHTPGCEPASNTTWLMSAKDAPQPDCSIRIAPECGGQSSDKGQYASGTPELAAEVCRSSTSFDLNQKLRLYERVGVQENVTVLLHEQEFRWHRLVNGAYHLLAPDSDGLMRSQVFPGLWLNPAALLAGDMAQVLAVLNDGLATPEHRAFVEQLAARKAAGAG